MMISDYQRQVLVENALDENDGTEVTFADVIADLSMGRSIADRNLFVAFLWRRVTVAVDAGASRKAHWVWSTAVEILDRCGEDLEDIFTGRPFDGLPVTLCGRQPAGAARSCDNES